MDAPNEIFLKDYKKPNYYFDMVDLRFYLGEEKTIVSSKIAVSPRVEGSSSPLVLDGQDMKLLSLRVNGQELKEGDYSLDSCHLTISSAPATAFTLEIITEICPQKNTSLKGLYKSSGNFCTQCEAEGFCKITYCQDCPDIMAKYTCYIEADKSLYPVLLSNGNLVEQGDLEGGKHFALWEDPFKKPCYLFALVAGQLESRDDTFVTRSGRKVLLRIWTPAQDVPKTAHAMYSLKAAMKWDEDVFGLEYDLDLFNVVAVPDFKMGTMANKSLNIFNSNLVLASPETASDADYAAILGVIGHEYFHNWTGNRLRRLFNEVMSLFLKAIGEKGMFRPVPAKLPCEKSVVLFNLFWVVREKGGYESVSKKKLWGLVAKKLGLGFGAMAGLKLLYFKYLSELEQWLNNRGKCGNFGLLSMELETEFRDLFSDCRLVQIQKRKKQLCLSDAKRSSALVKCNGSDNDKKFGDKDDKDISDHLLLLNCSGDDKKEKDNKRKRESLSGLVRWLTDIAKHSGDPSIGGPSFKLKGNEERELWVQAIRAREMLLLRRHVDSNNQESLLQKKLKMHPSMYEDNIVHSHQSAERSRCSKRLTNVAKSRLCSCCNSCSASPSKLIKSPRKVELVEVDDEPEAEAAVEVDLPDLANEVPPLEEEPIEKHVSVGPLYQADVPEWTGVVFDSDSKWLGTRVWPLELKEQKHSINETCNIGKGRPEFCGCPLPGSVECVRFHIAEARVKVKLELGPAFYHWKFNRMGEEVSLQWTAEQEKRFKDIVLSNKYFGDRKIRWFPTKTMENMVSYYFNVFLVQKRSYQNRVTPETIDSDDDEKEFGSIGGLFGNNAVDVLESNLGSCVQNTQCSDFD